MVTDMMTRLYYLVACALVLVLSSALHAAETRTITWDDLLPEGETELLDKMAEEMDVFDMLGHGGDPEWDTVPEQMGTFNTVDALDGQVIRLPGYVVPLELSADGKVKDFLLVPYVGACIHVPPPPPNQIVHVQAPQAETYGHMWQPVWVTGVMRNQRTLNTLGNTAYSLELQNWEFYDD